MYSLQGLEPLIRPGIRCGVPVIDGRIKLQSRVGTIPSRVDYLLP